MSLEAAMDEERREVLALLEGDTAVGTHVMLLKRRPGRSTKAAVGETRGKQCGLGVLGSRVATLPLLLLLLRA